MHFDFSIFLIGLLVPAAYVVGQFHGRLVRAKEAPEHTGPDNIDVYRILARLRVDDYDIYESSVVMTTDEYAKEFVEGFEEERVVVVPTFSGYMYKIEPRRSVS